jgi:hypothetical protein
MKVADFKSYLRGLLANHSAVTVEDYKVAQVHPLHDLKITDRDGVVWYMSIVSTSPPGGDGNRHAEPKGTPGVELAQR